MQESLDQIREELAAVRVENSEIKRTLHLTEGRGLADHNYSSNSRVSNHEVDAQEADEADEVQGHARPRRVTGSRDMPDLDDIQQEFIIIKDSLQRVRLPKDLKVEDSRLGVHRADQGRFNNISKCARYAETSVKLLSTLRAGQITDADINDLLTINIALVRYLQEEHALVHVNGSFGDNVEKIYRNFRKNTTVFDSQAIESLQAAVALDAAHPSSNTGGYYSSRGRGRWPYSGYRGRGYRGQSVYRFNRNLNSGNQFNNPGQNRQETAPAAGENF